MNAYTVKWLAYGHYISKHMYVMTAIKKINDDRYTTKRIVDSKGDLVMVRFTMKVYKEWVDENGEATVYHKTDKEGFKSPLVKEDYE